MTATDFLSTCSLFHKIIAENRLPSALVAADTSWWCWSMFWIYPLNTGLTIINHFSIHSILWLSSGQHYHQIHFSIQTLCVIGCDSSSRSPNVCTYVCQTCYNCTKVLKCTSTLTKHELHDLQDFHGLQKPSKVAAPGFSRLVQLYFILIYLVKQWRSQGRCSLSIIYFSSQYLRLWFKWDFNNLISKYLVLCTSG